MKRAFIHVDDSVNSEEFKDRVVNKDCKLVGTPMRGGGVITYNLELAETQVAIDLFEMLINDEKVQSLSFNR